MKVSRHAVTLAAAVLLSTMAPRIYAQVRIAVVDLQRAIIETEDGRRAKARLKKLFKQRQTALDEAQNQVKALKEEYDRQHQVWSASVKAQKEAALQKAYVDLQTKYMEYQRELATREAEATRDIVARMERILRRIGQTEGYTLILERSEGGVVWVPSNLDVTDLVIQRYNAGEGREEGGGAGGAGAGTGGQSGGQGGQSSTKAGGRTKAR
ncbi:MAG: OmpH family outer membrane protein [Sandaracinaceae bacterium]|nr:OmpH family outer membrane protein [Sandaracinaceae bacterium]